MTHDNVGKQTGVWGLKTRSINTQDEKKRKKIIRIFLDLLD